MKIVPMQNFLPTAQTMMQCASKDKPYLRLPTYIHLVLLVFTVTLLLGSTVVSLDLLATRTTHPGSNNQHLLSKVHAGETLSVPTQGSQTTIWTLAHVNFVPNIPQSSKPSTSVGNLSQVTGGLRPYSSVRGYTSNILEWSSPGQVTALLRQAAVRYKLPANLLLAIAKQESGWTQHVIAPDGGIGTMQIMPNTATWLNATARTHFSPYRLQDNINLGALYLRSLWVMFHGNITKVISAYNEGPGNVLRHGIFNWRYVNHVLYLMRTL